MLLSTIYNRYYNIDQTDTHDVFWSCMYSEIIVVNVSYHIIWSIGLKIWQIKGECQICLLHDDNPVRKVKIWGVLIQFECSGLDRIQTTHHLQKKGDD